MMANSKVVRAADYCRPDEGPVDSAARLAMAVLEALADGQSVSITMDKVSGASSSFFNVLFSELAGAIGTTAVKQRVEFVGLGKTQALIESKSRLAVLGA
jgi:hypothetical protein